MKYKLLLSALTASLIIIGCGSDSDSEEASTTTSVKTAYYIDAPIQNVNYVCGSQSGITGSDGSFEYETGSVCTFSLGGIVLRQTQSAVLDVNPKLFEENLTVAQLLQSLDADKNISNGITITDTEKEILEDQNELNITKIIDEINTKTDLNLSVVDINTTKANLLASMSDEIKKLLANQTFYVPFFDDSSKKFLIDQVKVDANATELLVTPYNYTDSSQTDTLEINGTAITIKEDDNTSNVYYFSEYTDKYITLTSNTESIKLFYNANDAEDYVNTLSTSTVGTYGGVLYYTDYNNQTPVKSGYIKFKINDNATGEVTLYLGNSTYTHALDINYSDVNNMPINIEGWSMGDVNFSLVAGWNDGNQSISGFIDVYDENGTDFYNFSAGK